MAVAAPSRTVARPALVLFVACIAQFMLVLDDTIVNVALPTVARELGFSESSLSWVVNAYLLTFGGFLLVGGRLADRFGPRRLFAISLAGFALASTLCGLAPTDEVLVGARAVQGIMGALLSPAALAILLGTFPEGQERRRALAMWAGLMGIGAAAGLLVGGALVEWADWRWVFLINLPVALVTLAAVPRVLPDFDASRARPAPNITGAVLATAALLLFVFTVVETDDNGWTSTRSVAGFVVAAVLAASFAWSERRAVSPLLPPELLRRPRAMFADASVFVAAGGLLAMFFFQTLFLQRVLGYGPLETGTSFLPFSLTMGAVSGLVSRLPDRVDARWAIVPGLVLIAAGLGLMSTQDPQSTYLGSILPALLLNAAGMGLALVPVMGLATGDSEERDGGLASGLMTSCQQIGGAVGIAVMITIATSATADSAAQRHPVPVALSDGFSAAFTVQAAVLVAAALFAAVTLGARRGEAG